VTPEQKMLTLAERHAPAVVWHALDESYSEIDRLRTALDAADKRIAYQSDLSKRQGERIQKAEAALVTLKAERDEWENRYNELLAEVGGVWPG